MKQLSIYETHQVQGASVLDDLSSLATNGISHQEVTLSSIVLGAGIFLGHLLPRVLVPIASIGIVAGWAIYDWKVNSK